MTLLVHLDAPDYYNRDAAVFAARYDSVSFDAVHPLLSRHLSASGCALDIGAGSGRDARAMAARGLEVTAVEPSDGLRAIGEANSDGIRWIDDRLPRLARIGDTGVQYDFILCSAVMMLVPPADLSPAFISIADLLGEGGKLGLNLREPGAGEPAELFFAHTDADVLAATRSAGLACIDRGEAEDAIGRLAYRWRNFVFARG